MGWDKQLYYTRSIRKNGRITREYVGGGQIGHLAARFDLLARQARKSKRAEFVAEREGIYAIEAPVEEFSEMTDDILRAVLLAAGFHQHKRGEWRKKRGWK